RLPAPHGPDHHALSLHDALPIWPTAAELIQQQLKQINVTGNIQLMDNVKLTTWYNQRDLVFVVGTPASFLFGPNAYFGQVYRSRSEEHTSELQSRSDLVCRLLLE